MHCLVLLVIDLLLISVSNASAVILCVDLQSAPGSLFQLFPYCSLTVAAAVPAVLATGLNRTLWRFTSLHDCLRILLATAVTVLAAVAIATMLDRMHGIPRDLPIMQCLTMASTLVGIRAFMRLRHSRRNRRRNTATFSATTREDVLVVGINAVAELFLRCVAENGARISVVGILSDGDRHRGRLLRSYPILGRSEAIGRIMRDLEIHGVRVGRIVIATQFDTLPAATQDALSHAERELGIRLDFLQQRFGLGDALKLSSRDRDVKEKDSSTPLPLSPMDLKLPVSRPYLRWKRWLDVVAATIGAICFAPLMLIVGVIVLFDVGYPLIFWQQRPGKLGRPIKVLKFRTMRSARDHQGRLLPDVQRLSVIGRFLRRTRLDELPQIYNVLSGQMSLIGPRPLLPVDQSPRFAARLVLRPGLTGWAQIKGGRHLTIHDKAALDLWYVKNASFGLDLRILLSTARTIVFGERVDHRAIREAWLELDCSPPSMTSEL